MDSLFLTKNNERISSAADFDNFKWDQSNSYDRLCFILDKINSINDLKSENAKITKDYMIPRANDIFNDCINELNKCTELQFQSKFNNGLDLLFKILKKVFTIYPIDKVKEISDKDCYNIVSTLLSCNKNNYR